MPYGPSHLPWHPIPRSEAGSTCLVYLMQAGSLELPTDLVLLQGPNKPNPSLDVTYSKRDTEMFLVPDFVFLIEHPATRRKFIFDLGMRKDLENSPPAVVNHTLPNFKCFPESPVDILKKYGTTEQQPSTVEAVIFSHLHFDHIGDAGKAGFSEAELWLGPSTCTSARPGYPTDEHSKVFSGDLPIDSSKKIVEFRIPTHLLDGKRKRAVEEALKRGNYEGISLLEPVKGWVGIGAFDRAFDLLGDGSAYLIDAPGHMSGHQMMLLRVKIGSGGEADDFVLLAGDCFHHPAMLANPLLTARPPYSKESMHDDPEMAIDTMFRTKRCAADEHIWVVGAHDFSITTSIRPTTEAVKGLVQLTDWREKGWKHQ